MLDLLPDALVMRSDEVPTAADVEFADYGRMAALQNLYDSHHRRGHYASIRSIFTRKDAICRACSRRAEEAGI